MKLKKKIAVSETGFIFDPTTGDSFSLNPTAAEILNLLKDGKNEKEIKKIIMTSYDVDESTFERSFLDFMAMLRLYNMIEEHEEN
ncbi:MAG: PqqD family protein [Bacteroidia bacterium]|nr:PqqD family protein [Bacteroidia bacterium]